MLNARQKSRWLGPWAASARDEDILEERRFPTSERAFQAAGGAGGMTRRCKPGPSALSAGMARARARPNVDGRLRQTPHRPTPTCRPGRRRPARTRPRRSPRRRGEVEAPGDRGPGGSGGAATTRLLFKMFFSPCARPPCQAYPRPLPRTAPRPSHLPRPPHRQRETRPWMMTTGTPTGHPTLRGTIPRVWGHQVA